VTGIADTFAVRFLTGPATFELPAYDAGTVSVFAANDVVSGVTEQGLAYPLDDATLSNRSSLGLSNELVGKAASVSVQKGTISVFYPLGL
ncbi:MAG: thiamine diphosphokinase, partial [Raoultibacter sp.]